MPPAPPARARRGGGVALGVLGTMLLAFFSIMFVMGRHTNLHTIYDRVVHDPRLGHHWMHEGEHAVLGAGAAARSQVRLLQQGQDMQRCARWLRLNCMCRAVAHSNCVLHESAAWPAVAMHRAPRDTLASLSRQEGRGRRADAAGQLATGGAVACAFPNPLASAFSTA